MEVENPLLTALSQVVIDALPEGILPDDLDLEDGDIEETLSAVNEALGNLGGSDGIDISQLGGLASQFGDLGSQLGGILGNSDGSGFDFSKLGGFGQLGGAAGYKGKTGETKEGVQQ